MKLKPKPKTSELIGGTLSPSVAIYQEMAKAITEEMRLMTRQVKREFAAAFKANPVNTAMDDSITSQSRIMINAMLMKWKPRFRDLAQRVVDKMIRRTVRNSTATLKMSLKEVSENLSIDTTLSDERLKEVIAASTQEAAQLIKRIPEQYLSDVQGQVMRSITTGRGMQDLVPYLTKKYNGDVKWARHVAMDQTRKAYSNINAVRLQKLGCKSFIWIHTGGGVHPRKLHIEMSGNEYRYDDLPVIDERTGQRGKPGDAIFCRCIQKPVFRFAKDAA